MVAYYRPLLYASAWQLGTWLVALAAAMRLAPLWANGVFWGGLVMAVNFSLLRFVANLWHMHGGLSRSVAALIAGKWLLLLALVCAIMHWAQPHGGGMALGMGSLFFGIFGALLHRNAPSFFHRRRQTVQSD